MKTHLFSLTVYPFLFASHFLLLLLAPLFIASAWYVMVCINLSFFGWIWLIYDTIFCRSSLTKKMVLWGISIPSLGYSFYFLKMIPISHPWIYLFNSGVIGLFFILVTLLFQYLQIQRTSDIAIENV